MTSIEGSSASFRAEPRSKAGALIVLLGLGLLLFRMVHLGADPPQSIWAASIGEFVDEGYKTLDARNRALFGTTHWNAEDDYPGWTRKSPITQWSYFAAFQLFGTVLSNARGVTILFFGIFLWGYLSGAAKRFSMGLTMGGLLMLGLGHHLFVFSRLALFEIAILTALYAVLFIWSRLDERNSRFEVLILLIAAFLSTFGIKQSSLAYFALVAIGLVLSWVASWKSGSPGPRILLPVVTVSVGIVGLLAATRETWWHRLDLSFQSLVRSVLESSLIEATPLFILGGVFCATHLILSEPRASLQSPYRASLIVLVLLGPPTFAVFTSGPLRYLVPLLPAYVLVILEWLYSRSWRFPPARLPTIVALPIWMTAWMMVTAATVHALNRFVLGPLTGTNLSPEWTEPLPLTFVVVAGPTLGLALWAFRSRLLVGPKLRIAVIATAVLAVGVDTLYVLESLVQPSYQREEIAQELEARLPAGSSIAGDWAPLFTVDTRLKSLYSSRRFNKITRLAETRPDYLMCSDSPGDACGLTKDSWPPGVRLGQPVVEAEYVGRALSVHPVEYLDGPASGSAAQGEPPIDQ